MKKLSFLPFMFFVLIQTCFSQEPFSDKKFDFSGLDKFWSLVSILEQDKHPSKYQWECLFNTPGYAALTESEFKKETFILLYQSASKKLRTPEFSKKTIQFIKKLELKYIKTTLNN